ncbi:hypothetical protein QBZ16_001476 [Prototheca wickerhamii]|uniref:CCHC-type domain-containing protein n=1 Tax=Prototheca wickerhamii TaxID=3111 RepID=A0AAD9MIW8_PROWI|nr:hypothetical protein QBZ16_001476 [Prototheca wickerhamii]
MPDQQPGQARATGCYKCGKPGHWARDCPGPTGNEGNQSAIADGQVGLDGAPGPGTGETGAPPVGKPKRTRRKVTLDLLKQTSGIPDVYHTFPEVFKRQARGKGHEVSDLRRLLELYMRWQQRVFPGVEFDRFIADVERLSGTHAVKHEMHEMRMALLMEAKAAVQPPEPAAEAPDSTAAAPADDPELDLAIDEEAEDEEDLLALLAEPMDAEAPDGGTQGNTQEEDLALPEDDMLGSLPPEAYAAALEDDDDEMALERALAEA